MGIAAALTGLFMLSSAILRTETFRRFWLTARIEARFGSNAARVAGVLAGMVVLLIGILLLLGLLPARSRTVATIPQTGSISPDWPGGVRSF